MSLLDRDLEPIIIYPEVEGTDYAGNPARVPDFDHGIERMVRIKTPDTTEAAVEGQHVQAVARVMSRQPLPAGAFSVVRARGRLWDVTGEVARRTRTSATAHDAMTIVTQHQQAVPEVPTEAEPDGG